MQQKMRENCCGSSQQGKQVGQTQKDHREGNTRLSKQGLWSSIDIDMLISVILFLFLLVVNLSRKLVTETRRNGSDPKV